MKKRAQNAYRVIGLGIVVGAVLALIALAFAFFATLSHVEGLQ